MPNNAVYTKEFAAKLYETMCTIRKFEECVKHDFLAGEIPGFTIPTSVRRPSLPACAPRCGTTT